MHQCSHREYDQFEGASSTKNKNIRWKQIREIWVLTEGAREVTGTGHQPPMLRLVRSIDTNDESEKTERERE